MLKARVSVLYVTTALTWLAAAGPALAQDSAPMAQTADPNSAAPAGTPVASDQASQPAAQAPIGDGIFSGDLVVTAQKRREKIQDVGISITALSGDTIKSLNLSNMQQISQQVPNLQVSTWTPAFTTFNLRGISQNNFQDNLEAPVAVYMDDVYVGSMNALGLPMFDIERVEVLRGPQGTL
ncbi:MAG TPA: Plug domain-containing protein, partial [Sphingomicrobium sp.]|nr:Plug domain-containing protein [Sphingomicrobium sp.]